MSLDQRRILIVEDEFMIAAMAEDMLGDAGAIPLGPAGTVAEALAAIASEPPDAAMVDVNLNGVRSEPVMEALSEAGVPYLIVSGYAFDPAASPAPHLAKPYTQSELCEALEALFA